MPAGAVARDLRAATCSSAIGARAATDRTHAARRRRGAALSSRVPGLALGALSRAQAEAIGTSTVPRRRSGDHDGGLRGRERSRSTRSGAWSPRPARRPAGDEPCSVLVFSRPDRQRAEGRPAVVHPRRQRSARALRHHQRTGHELRPVLRKTIASASPRRQRSRLPRPARSHGSRPDRVSSRTARASERAGPNHSRWRHGLNPPFLSDRPTATASTERSRSAGRRGRRPDLLPRRPTPAPTAWLPVGQFTGEVYWRRARPFGSRGPRDSCAEVFHSKIPGTWSWTRRPWSRRGGSISASAIAPRSIGVAISSSGSVSGRRARVGWRDAAPSPRVCGETPRPGPGKEGARSRTAGPCIGGRSGGGREKPRTLRPPRSAPYAGCDQHVDRPRGLSHGPDRGGGVGVAFETRARARSHAAAGNGLEVSVVGMDGPANGGSDAQAEEFRRIAADRTSDRPNPAISALGTHSFQGRSNGR